MSTVIWRLSRAHRADSAFTGKGSAIKAGRWNIPGAPVVYTSATLSLALLEILVHIALEDLPDLDLVAFRAELPDQLAIETQTVDQLPSEWRDSPCPSLRDIGNRWLTSATAPVLAVPSVIVPQDINYLLNPNHPDFDKIVIDAAVPFTLDQRFERQWSEQ